MSGGADGEPRVLRTQGRDVEIPRAAPGVAGMADFLDWCARPMGAADFITIAANFHTVIVADIPRMGPDSQDKAVRFVTMIDEFYEKKVKFICSAATAPSGLYREGDGVFEFQRTVSRLMEMQSPEPACPRSYRLIVIVGRARLRLGSRGFNPREAGYGRRQHDFSHRARTFAADGDGGNRTRQQLRVVGPAGVCADRRPVTTPADERRARSSPRPRTARRWRPSRDARDRPGLRHHPGGAGDLGVHAHIADLCRRFAKAGYYAVAPELYFRQGDPKGYTEIPKLISEVVAKVPDEQVMGDLVTPQIAFAKGEGKADTAKLGVTGFAGAADRVAPTPPPTPASRRASPGTAASSAKRRRSRPSIRSTSPRS